MMAKHLHLPSRRDVGRACAAAAAGALVARTSRAAEPAAAAATPARRYIDVHTHIGQIWNHTRPLTAEGLLQWMDANDIERAVVLPAVNPEACSFPLTSDYVLAQTEPHRDRLIPFCCID